MSEQLLKHLQQYKKIARNFLELLVLYGKIIGILLEANLMLSKYLKK